jgi:hypothetical protein
MESHRVDPRSVNGIRCLIGIVISCHFGIRSHEVCFFPLSGMMERNRLHTSFLHPPYGLLRTLFYYEICLCIPLPLHRHKSSVGTVKSIALLLISPLTPAGFHTTPVDDVAYVSPLTYVFWSLNIYRNPDASLYKRLTLMSEPYVRVM